MSDRVWVVVLTDGSEYDVTIPDDMDDDEERPLHRAFEEQHTGKSADDIDDWWPKEPVVVTEEPYLHPIIAEEYERSLSFSVARDPDQGDTSWASVATEAEHRASIEFLIEHRHRLVELGISPAEFHQSLATLESLR